MDSELTDYYYQLEQENEKLKQKVSKLEKNGLRMDNPRFAQLLPNGEIQEFSCLIQLLYQIDL